MRWVTSLLLVSAAKWRCSPGVKFNQKKLENSIQNGYPIYKCLQCRSLMLYCPNFFRFCTAACT